MDTVANYIDQLSITNIKIFMLEDIKRNNNATNDEIAEATKKTNVLNQYRTDLIQWIDEGLNKIAEGNKQKLYKQGETKMYGK